MEILELFRRTAIHLGYYLSGKVIKAIYFDSRGYIRQSKYMKAAIYGGRVEKRRWRAGRRLLSQL